MSVLRAAEKTLTDLVVQFHWISHEVSDPVVAQHLRKVADSLSEAADELRRLWKGKPLTELLE